MKVGSIAGIAGAVVAMVGNLAHPATPLDDHEGVARTIAASDIWVADHLAIVVGLVLMLGGLIAIRHSVDGAAESWAKLGHAAAVAGTTVGLILVTLDGLAAKQLAVAWTNAPTAEAPVALRLLIAEETMNFALASLFNVLFAGFAFGLYGVAVARSGRYPRWLGWLVVAAAAGSICAGLIQALAGEPTPVTRVLTIVFPTVITAWLAAMGVLILRRLPEGAVAEL